VLSLPGVQSSYVVLVLVRSVADDSTEYSLGPRVEPPKQANHGDSDASLDSTPSQFLLFRGLEPSVSEEMLAKGAAKLYKVNEVQNTESTKKSSRVASTTSSSNFGAQEESIKRVFVVRSRENDESWRYGFAEFHTVEVRQNLFVGNASAKF
jgi:hypothetical protein